ncbi:YggN family protein [Aureisphaera sp.]
MKLVRKTVFAVLLMSFAVMTAQTKSVEQFNVGNDVLVSVNTSHTNIVFETWNKDVVEVEAFIDDESLSEEEKRIVFEKWNLKVLGNSKEVVITSNEGSLWGGIESMGSLKVLDRMKSLESLKHLEGLKEIKMSPLFDALGDMEFNIAIPDVPELEKMPRWPFNGERPNFKDGNEYSYYSDHNKRSQVFDRGEYRKNKQRYVSKLNDKFNSNVTVGEVDDWLDEVEDWKKNIEDVMEDWGEEFGNSIELKFGEDFEKDMEKWGEEFGKSMEEWGEEFGKDMEKWGEEFGKDMEKWAEQFEKDAEKWAEQFDGYDNQVITSPTGDKTIIINGNRNGLFDEPVKAKKTIIIRMPKNTRTDINVRHGEVKMTDVYNVKANLDYSTLTANSIDGGNTLINASYAPVYVNNWIDGMLDLKYVDDCKLNEVHSINLQANSSNVNVNSIVDKAFLSGSFGNLYVKEINPSFSNVDIVLENTDAYLDLPSSSFTFQYSGKKSRFESPASIEITSKNKNTSHTMLKGYKGSNGSSRSVTINASYSNVRFNN